MSSGRLPRHETDPARQYTQARNVAAYRTRRDGFQRLAALLSAERLDHKATRRDLEAMETEVIRLRIRARKEHRL